jgi:hypothetical protein
MSVGGAYRHIPGGAEAAEQRHKEEMEEIKERQRIWGPISSSPRGPTPGKVQAGNEIGPSDVRVPSSLLAYHASVRCIVIVACTLLLQFVKYPHL